VGRDANRALGWLTDAGGLIFRGEEDPEASAVEGTAVSRRAFRFFFLASKNKGRRKRVSEEGGR
jgi:hypothetical protein